MPKILFLEDDKRFAGCVIERLSGEHHQIEHVDSAQDGAYRAEHFNYDLLVLDCDLPDESAPKLFKRIRNSGNKTPILMLSGSLSTSSMVADGDCCADDIVETPCQPEELSIRIRAILRREHRFENIIQSGDIRIDVMAKTMLIGKQEVNLTADEFSLFEFMVNHPEIRFTAKTLIDKVFDHDSGIFERDLTVHFCNIRTKFSELGRVFPISFNDGEYVFSIHP